MTGWRSILRGEAATPPVLPPIPPFPPKPRPSVNSGGNGDNGGLRPTQPRRGAAPIASVSAKLEAQGSEWDAADWQAYFDERAGILEFDGGLLRHEAEARAWECCVAQWLIRNPVRSAPGQCHGCGENGAREPLLPYGTGEYGHIWLHQRCWNVWYADRKAEAVAALKALGLEPDSTK
jgi:hypothetical protein